MYFRDGAFSVTAVRFSVKLSIGALAVQTLGLSCSLLGGERGIGEFAMSLFQIVFQNR